MYWYIKLNNYAVLKIRCNITTPYDPAMTYILTVDDDERFLQSATTNHVVMGGVSKLSSSLQYFIWGLTVELLKVTDLFIDQVESGARGGGNAPKKSGTGDSIPILKPISDDRSSGEGASQVDILALPKLQRVLSTLLPQTKIKILKIPFSATWRQTVTDVPA